MLNKLLKHEFRATARIMLPTLGGLLLMAVLASISFQFIGKIDNAFLTFALGLLIAGFFAAIVAAVVLNVVVVVQRFYKNLLGDEGYLMFTLPVSTHSLLWSKMIVSFFWYVITAICCFAAMMFTMFAASNSSLESVIVVMPSMNELLTAMAEAMQVSKLAIVGYAIELLLIGIVSLCGLCLSFYSALAVGHMFSQRKMLMSVLAFIALSFAQNLCYGLVTTLAGTFGSYLIDLENMSNNLTMLLTGVLIYQLLQSAVLYFISYFSLKNRLNLP